MRSRPLVAVIAVALVATACTSTTRTARATRANRAERPAVRVDAHALAAIADHYRTTCRSPGAAVGLMTADGIDHYAVSGRLAAGVALDRKSDFLAGSVTKLFVATVAFQLVEAHKIALTDTVSRYLPGWPRGNEITIGMLLGHRSGMGDFGNDFGKQLTDLVVSDLSRVFTYDEVLGLVRAVPPVAAPGATYHYSNANYIVLGAILQRLTHATLGQLLDARIIDPLHLEHTLYGPDDLGRAQRVVFHGLFDVTGTGHPIDIAALPRAAALTVDPAGAGLFSSLPDLLTFTHALFATRALLSSSARSALEHVVTTITAKDLVLGNQFAVTGHGGASPGAQTIVAYDHDHEATVAVWCNRLDPGTNELVPSVIAVRQTLQLVAAAEAKH
jgi:D-alanyl-D-alanine carboxypeptidase